MERCPIVLKHVLKGEVTLPSKEAMTESLNQELAACWEGKWRYLYLLSPPSFFKIYEELYSLLPEGTYKGKGEKLNG